MGKHLLIIGFDGTHEPTLAAEITKLLCDKKLSVRHASVRYDGHTNFAVGTPDDLRLDLIPGPITVTSAPPAEAPAEAAGITLETIRADALREEKKLDSFARYEKKDDKEKGPKGGKKVEATAPAPVVTPPAAGDQEQSEQVATGDGDHTAKEPHAPLADGSGPKEGDPQQKEAASGTL